ncbi:MAG: YajQ family cyclic di-GMP-binding protein [Acidobacteriota bacterium]|nr:YajQ family cyclic di-GMP-binding protein [Acidobacteriota bacterium]MDH3522472.1 YajQ family cyclic di-GMP-binding protein [Acidobacteriota bacterium]
MPSFDIVVETDLQEVDNAVHQAQKELGQRYDFRGSKSRIDWDKGSAELTLTGDDDFKLAAVLDVLQGKLVKRGVAIKNLTVAKAEDAAGGLRRQKIALAQGIDGAICKEIVKRIKQAKLKVQAQIQDDQVRVTGKKRDDLQAVIAMVREADLGPEFAFRNMRD